MKKWILIPIVLIGVVGVLVVGIGLTMMPGGENGGGGDGKGSSKKGGGWGLFSSAPGKEVEVGEIQTGDLTATISAPGIITPAQEVAISSRLPGRILEIFVDEGWPVEEGQVIAKLETKEFELTLERARSDMEVAKSRVEEAMATLAQAQVAAARSAAELERKETLHDQGAFSDSEIDQARNQADRDALQETVASKSLGQAEEARRTAALGLERAQRDMSETEVRSPLGGTVTARNVNVGERVILGVAGDPSSALFIVSDLSEILVYADVDEIDVTRVKPEQPVAVRVEALKDEEFGGKVRDVAPRANRQGDISTFRTRIRIEGDISKLRPGMSAQAEVEVERALGAMVVPLAAVLERKRDPKDVEGGDSPGTDEPEYYEVIFVIDEDGVVHEREVETGILDAKKVEIKSGLDGDERIVTGPYRTLSKLKDGETVRVKKPRDSGDEGKKGDDKPAGPPEEGDGGPEKASADPAPGGAEKSGGEEPGAGPEPE